MYQALPRIRRPFSPPALATLTTVLMLAQGPAARADLGAEYAFDIPAQPLGQALVQFSKQADMQVVGNADALENLETKGVSGQHTGREALKLLIGTNRLTFREISGRAIVISAVESPQKAIAADGVASQSGAQEQQKTTPPKNSSQETEGAPGSQSGTNQLQEIVVTSQRREESIDKVPISITALTQKNMDDLHIQNVNDLATVVPGLTLTPPVAVIPDFADIGIRGVYSSANGGVVGNAPTTQLYIDETPIAIRQLGAAASRSPWPEIFDLDRVEVLRGPQGTLFGASAMGGAIRFITPQPNLHNSSGFLKADLGYTEEGQPNYEIGGAYGGVAVPDVVAFRGSAWLKVSGGFIDQVDPFTGQTLQKNANTANVYVVRPAITVAPSEALTITPALYAQRTHDQNPPAYWITNPAGSESNNRVWGGLSQPMTDNLRVSSLSIKYELPKLSLVSDTSYLDRKSDAFEDLTHIFEVIFGGKPFIPGLESFRAYDHNFSYTDAWQQEFRLSSHDDSSKVSWVAGAFYRHATQRLQQLQTPDLTPVTEYAFQQSSLQFFKVPNYIYGGQVLNFYDDYRATDVSEAIFADVTYAATEHLKVDAGVRYEHLIVEHQTQINAGPLNGLGVEFSNVLLPDVSEHPVTPRFSLTYQITDDNMVYLSAAKGYRAGGANVVNINANPQCQKSLNDLGLSAAPTTFNSDSLWSYEIGTKDSFLDRRLSVEGSAYYIKWSDIQTNVTLPSCANAFTRNQGEAVSEGFDLQIAALVTNELKATASVGYTNAYFPNATYGAPVNGVVPLLNGSGDKLRNVLPWTAAASTEYSRGVTVPWPETRMYVRLDYRWLDGAPRGNPALTGYDPDLGDNPNPPYGILNVRLGFIHGGLDLSAYVNNLTTSDPRLGYYHDVPGDPLFYASAIRPRTFGVTTWYRF